MRNAEAEEQRSMNQKFITTLNSTNMGGGREDMEDLQRQMD